MLDEFFLWIGTYYRDVLYLGGSKIAGVLCSFADIFVAGTFLRIMDLIRKRPASKVRFAILGLFALLTPSLLFPRTGFYFFIAQFLVLAPPYLILVYTAVVEARYFVAHVKEQLASGGRADHGSACSVPPSRKPVSSDP